MSDEYDLDEADGRCEECGSLDGLHLVDCSRAPRDEDDDEPAWDAEQEYRRADQIRQEDEMNERWELEQELTDHDDCPECLGSGRDGGSSAPCPACFKPARK